MKRLTRGLMAGLIVLAMAGTAYAGSIRVQNSDSKDHTVKLKCSGSSKSFTIRGSTTSTYTFHSSSKSCDIVGGTIDWPVKKLEDGKKWKIKNGKATPN